MTQQGTVVFAEKGFVQVRIERKSACAGCHQSDGCHNCASALIVRAENRCAAVEGDTVEVETPTARVLFYSVAVFLLPLLLAFGGYFLCALLCDMQILSVLSFFLVLILSFLLLRFTLDRRAEKGCAHRAVRITNGCMEED